MSVNVNNIEGLNPAINGMIYEFLDSDFKNSDRHVLVVQNNARSEDNVASVLLVGDKKGYNCDTIPIKFGGVTHYVHCGMVTYVQRTRLGKKKANVSDETMERIKRNIAVQLGLLDDDNDYKAMYEQLLDKVIKEIR